MTKEETTKKKSTSSAKKTTEKDTKTTSATDTKKAEAPKKTAAKKSTAKKKKEPAPAKPKVPKKEVIKTHQTHAKDTGSSQVQIAVLTNKIEALSEHLKTHGKDKHSRRGLIGLVGKRRKLLRYLQMTDAAKYSHITKQLGLRK